MTYTTHRVVLAIVAGWILLIVVPQCVMSFVGDSSPSDRAPLAIMIVGMPLLFLSAMFVAQAKAQFAHSRRLLMPGFAGPHVKVLATLLVTLVLIYPLLIAGSLGFDLLGIIALAAAIAAPTVWAAHLNRFLPALVGLVAFYSTVTPAGANWWLFDAAQHRPIHALILLTGISLIAGWLWRLSQLREEMDDYLSLIQWRMARKSGSEVAEQRRIVAESIRRHKLAAWMGDAWLARMGGYHGGDRLRLARLLRYGFGQPAELQGLMFAVMFFALTYFLAEYGFGGKGPGGFGSISFYLMFAMLFPGFMPGEMLAQLRPRIATHLLRPLDRRQLVDGLLSATGWNVCAMWICMNVGLVLQAYYVVPDDQSTPELFGTMIFLSAAMTLAMAGVTMRIAVWPSQLKRMFAFWVTLILFMPTLVAWQIARDKYGDWPFVAAGLLLAAFGVWMITQARRAWMNLELG